jgi:predicted NodU family carbamoyl transferase
MRHSVVLLGAFVLFLGLGTGLGSALVVDGICVAAVAEERISRPVVEMDFERARLALIKALTRLEVSRHSRPRP